jgi:hypothetical protein
VARQRPTFPDTRESGYYCLAGFTMTGMMTTGVVVGCVITARH